MTNRVVALVLLAAALWPATADAQRRRRGGGVTPGDYKAFNVPYDGRFAFVRIRYSEDMWGFRRNPGWAHDYPTAERNFAKILDELSFIHPVLEGSNILMFDDPELTRFPVAYLSEPGFWTMSEAEADGLRNYLLKGGFLIVDDFRSPREWYTFSERLHQALPDARLVQLDAKHPIFDSFFHIPNLEQFQPPTFQEFTPEFWGVYEDNDDTKRLMVIVNFNNDIGDYWEWSATGWIPIDLSNEAYKLGVNYVIYGLTR